MNQHSNKKRASAAHLEDVRKRGFLTDLRDETRDIRFLITQDKRDRASEMGALQPVVRASRVDPEEHVLSSRLPDGSSGGRVDPDCLREGCHSVNGSDVDIHYEGARSSSAWPDHPRADARTEGQAPRPQRTPGGRAVQKAMNPNARAVPGWQVWLFTARRTKWAGDLSTS